MNENDVLKAVVRSAFQSSQIPGFNLPQNATVQQGHALRQFIWRASGYLQHESAGRSKPQQNQVKGKKLALAQLYKLWSSFSKSIKHTVNTKETPVSIPAIGLFYKTRDEITDQMVVKFDPSQRVKSALGITTSMNSVSTLRNQSKTLNWRLIGDTASIDKPEFTEQFICSIFEKAIDMARSGQQIELDLKFTSVELAQGKAQTRGQRASSIVLKPKKHNGCSPKTPQQFPDYDSTFFDSAISARRSPVQPGEVHVKSQILRNDTNHTARGGVSVHSDRMASPVGYTTPHGQPMSKTHHTSINVIQPSITPQPARNQVNSQDFSHMQIEEIGANGQDQNLPKIPHGNLQFQTGNLKVPRTALMSNIQAPLKDTNFLSPQRHQLLESRFNVTNKHRRDNTTVNYFTTVVDNNRGINGGSSRQSNMRKTFYENKRKSYMNEIERDLFDFNNNAVTPNTFKNRRTAKRQTISPAQQSTLFMQNQFPRTQEGRHQNERSRIMYNRSSNPLNCTSESMTVTNSTPLDQIIASSTAAKGTQSLIKKQPQQQRIWGQIDSGFADGNRVKEADREQNVRKAVHQANLRYTFNVQRAHDYEQKLDTEVAVDLANKHKREYKRKKHTIDSSKHCSRFNFMMGTFTKNQERQEKEHWAQEGYVQTSLVSKGLDEQKHADQERQTHLVNNKVRELNQMHKTAQHFHDKSQKESNLKQDMQWVQSVNEAWSEQQRAEKEKKMQTQANLTDSYFRQMGQKGDRMNLVSKAL